MKPTVHSKSSPTSSTSSKSKKSSKEKEKRKSQSNSSDSSTNDRGSPSKDARQYAGISSESIYIYAEQSNYKYVTEEFCEVLSEDINYKLRYIIHDALLKARLSGRTAINHRDIDESFENLSIEKVYGATVQPTWKPIGEEDLLYLDDTKVNLFEIAEEETNYAQHGDIVLEKNWFPDAEPSAALKDYFMALCKSVISNDEDLRKMALQDISENSQIGPIIEWFYHFGYFLLMKDITYDCLTLSALQLIETLENCPLGSANVSEKQLKLLVRLLVQRLLISTPTKEVLKPLCSVLAVLCLRQPLKEMAIAKVINKVGTQENILPVLWVIYFLGIDAVREIFLPNIEYFCDKVMALEDTEPEINAMLAIYGLLCKAGYNYNFIHEAFQRCFGSVLVMFWRPKDIPFKADLSDEELNFVNMKTQLIKTRRKVDCHFRKGQDKLLLADVFEIPTHSCPVERKIEEHCTSMSLRQFKRETHITVGKTSLLLSVLRNKKNKASLGSFCEHSLLSYNI